MIDDGFKIIYLNRTNILKHAVSNMRAQSLGYHQLKKDKRQFEKIYLDPSDLERWMDLSRALQCYESRLLDGLPHLNLTYEHNLEHEENHQATINHVCSYLSVQTIECTTDYTKISPTALVDSVSNFDQVVSHLSKGKYKDEFRQWL